MPRALAYADACGESSSPSMSSTNAAFFRRSGSALPTAADVGQDGSVYTPPSESPVYAVIGLEEYLDGSQDWTLCTPPDLGPVGPAATR